MVRTLRDWLDIPVIFLLGICDDTMIARGKLINPVRFLHKPSCATEIIGALEAASESLWREARKRSTHFNR
jgi:FixJ family two-component response regulator